MRSTRESLLQHDAAPRRGAAQRRLERARLRRGRRRPDARSRVYLPRQGCRRSSRAERAGHRRRIRASRAASASRASRSSTSIRVAEPSTPTDDVLVARRTSRGDFSTYTLRLRRRREHRPALRPSRRRSRFKVDCPSDLDCAAGVRAASRPSRRARIDYLAKDYASFRQLILDRLALLMPGLARAARARPRRRRWSSCSPTSATTSATTRTRSRPRPISTRRASGSRCGATRGWSTTPCTRLQRARLGLRSRRRRDADAAGARRRSASSPALNDALPIGADGCAAGAGR